MAYIPIPVKAPRTPKGRNTFLIVFTCIFLVAGLCCLFAGLATSSAEDVSDLADLAYGSIADGEAYYSEEVYVLTEYAVYSNEDGRWNYYLIGFEDRDGEVVYASLQVEPDTTLGKQCEDYMDILKDAEEDEEIDPLVLKGVFSCAELNDEPNDIVDWYEEKYEEALDIIGPGEDIRMNFTYEAKDKDAYQDKKKDESTAMLIVGIVFIVGSAIALFFLIRHRRKIKEAEAAQVNFDGDYPNDMNGGYGAPNGGYGAPNGGYGAPNGGYGAPNGGYGAPNGGYGVPNGGYGAPNGGYGAPNGGYGAPNGGYGAPNGGYGAPNGGYGAPNGGYGAPNGGYGAPNGGYGAPNGGYANPVENPNDIRNNPADDL